MIISASFRTDIPAFYGQWFESRFRAGFCRVTSPYGGPPSRVDLRDGVDGFVFWTRNARPFLPALALVRRAGSPFTIQYTLTAYPREIERAVVEADASIAVVRRLAADFGPRAVVWRYDPILLTDLTTPEWHVGTFSRLAERLAGSVDEVVASFAQPYRKTARNLATAAKIGHFAWWDPPIEEKRRAIERLSAIARDHGMTLRLCTQPGLAGDVAPAARCVDPSRLSDVADRPIAARSKGNRPGCLCAGSRDIGAYDSCPQGCAYCYAVHSREEAKANLARHDPDGEFLLPPEGQRTRQKG